MKLAKSLIVAAVLAVPALSFAQANQPVTRAEVRAELVQLQKAGYNPASDQTQYPNNIQATLARIDAEHNVAATSVGGSSDTTSASGSRANKPMLSAFNSTYDHP